MNKLDIVVAPGPWDPAPWRSAFEAKAGGRRVHLWPHDGERVDAAAYVICSWKAEPRIFDALKHPTDNGTLSGAVLDVFALEPLAADDPLWSMGNVLITPHVAADSDAHVVVGQIMHEVQRLESGLALQQAVDLRRGY